MDIGSIIFGPRTDVNQIIRASGPKRVWPWPISVEYGKDNVMAHNEPVSEEPEANESVSPVRRPDFYPLSIAVRYLDFDSPFRRVRKIDVQGEFKRGAVAFSLTDTEREALNDLLQAAADRYIRELAAHLLPDEAES